MRAAVEMSLRRIEKVLPTNRDLTPEPASTILDMISRIDSTFLLYEAFPTEDTMPALVIQFVALGRLKRYLQEAEEKITTNATSEVSRLFSEFGKDFAACLLKAIDSYDHTSEEYRNKLLDVRQLEMFSGILGCERIKVNWSLQVTGWTQLLLTFAKRQGGGWK